MRQREITVADEEHIGRLKQGVDAWNAWRRSYTELRRLDLSNADLSNADLSNADLRRVDLSNADLRGARLRRVDLSSANLERAVLRGVDLNYANLTLADLSHAHLTAADLSHADLSCTELRGVDLRSGHLNGADLSAAKLSDANLSRMDLTRTDLSRADLSGTNLAEARLYETIFVDLNLSSVVGLETCHHHGPSIIDHRTLQKSGSLPTPFLRGVGLPERLIDYLPTLFNQAIRYYSGFISYSTKDQEFADRIYADLQNKGIRCWFAPHDIPIGAKILDEIDAAIRLRDKLLLILSEHSIKSDWVEDEVTKAFEEERKRGQIVLFPIRLDDMVMHTNEAWAAKLRARNIGDFRSWTDHNAYKASLERVIRDLTQSPK
jgi:uncharacterized protein YjbI with pentapeptide repeats